MLFDKTLMIIFRAQLYFHTDAKDLYLIREFLGPLSAKPLPSALSNFLWVVGGENSYSR